MSMTRYLAKHDAPIASAAAMTPDADLPQDFISCHRNTYLSNVKHPYGEYRDALVVVEPDPADPGHPRVITLRYTIFAFEYCDRFSPERLGQPFATGTFPVPADADLSDGNLHCYAAHIVSSPRTVPTVEEVAAMLAPGGLGRHIVRQFPSYAYEVLLEWLEKAHCAHGRRLTDSCPSC